MTMPIERYAVEWEDRDGGPLRGFEPTREELSAGAPLLSEYYNEPTNRALMTNEHDYSANDVVLMYERMWEAGGRQFFLACGDTLVGDCDLRNIEHDRAEYAVLVGPRQTQAKGLGTRFSIMVLALAFGRLGLRRVYASIRPENAGSLRMFAKVGYAIDEGPDARRYAEAPDDVCVSIGPEELGRAYPHALAEVRITVRGA